MKYLKESLDNLNNLLPLDYRVKIPEPPKGKANDSYQKEFREWFQACLTEIEIKTAQFRDDYWHKVD